MNEQESTSLKEKLFDNAINFLIAEYNSLRSEILKRTEIQFQVIFLTLIATGTFLSVGLPKTVTLILIYPILGMFLAAIWILNDIRIQQIGSYISKRIEEPILSNSLGWEHTRRSGKLVGTFSSIILWSSRGILIGTQLLTILIAILYTCFTLEDIILLIIDLIAVICTVVLLRRKRIIIEQIL